MHLLALQLNWLYLGEWYLVIITTGVQFILLEDNNYGLRLTGWGG